MSHFQHWCKYTSFILEMPLFNLGLIFPSISMLKVLILAHNLPFHISYFGTLEKLVSLLWLNPDNCTNIMNPCKFPFATANVPIGRDAIPCRMTYQFTCIQIRLDDFLTKLIVKCKRIHDQCNVSTKSYEQFMWHQLKLFLRYIFRTN